MTYVFAVLFGLARQRFAGSVPEFHKHTTELRVTAFVTLAAASAERIALHGPRLFFWKEPQLIMMTPGAVERFAVNDAARANAVPGPTSWSKDARIRVSFVSAFQYRRPAINPLIRWFFAIPA
jgi:hypothetical protein